MKPLIKTKVPKAVEGGSINVGFNSKSNRHLFDDAIKRCKDRLSPSELKDIDKDLKRSTFVKTAPNADPKKKDVSKFYYFKDAAKQRYYNVAEKVHKRPDGRVQKVRYSYSVTKGIK